MSRFVDPPGFAEWDAKIPAALKRDPIWRTPAYRYGVWHGDLAKADAIPLYRVRESRNNADQLIRSSEGISSNLAEGYGCFTGPERARYYGYALTSTRETLDWYFKAREILGTDIVEHRFEVLDRIVRILTVVIPRERRRSRRDRRPKDDDAP